MFAEGCPAGEDGAEHQGDVGADASARDAAARWAGSCTARWGICPCCGQALRTDDVWSWCRGCESAWDRREGPCGEPGAFVMMDLMGGTALVCAAHGRFMRDRLDGGLLLPVPTA